MFTSFSSFSPFLPQCRPRDGCSQIYSKINTNTWIIFNDPKQKDESTLKRPFPQQLGLVLHQIYCAQAFFFTAEGEE